MNRFLFILIACVLGLPRLSANAEEPLSITAQNYCRFLKCVAVSDPHCFYDEKLASDPTCIAREGTPGNYAYSVLPGKEKQLVSYLTWHDVACYAYWNQQKDDYLSNDLTLSSNGFQVDNAAQSSDQELKSNIVHFSLINDKTLDNGTLPSQEPPSWINYMMIPILFLGESGQAVSKVSPDHVSMPTLSRPSYRFHNGAWERKVLEGIWEPTDRFNEPPAPPEVLMSFMRHYNRADNISTKKEEYQKELKILAPDSNRALMLNHLVPILEKAISYQDSLIKSLIESVGTLGVGSSKKTLDDPKKVALKTFRNFISAIMINDHPNKVELIAKQIEEDYEHLARYQNKLLEVEAQIDDNQPGPLNGLFESREHLNKAIQFQRTLIEQRALHAPLLHPPCKQLDEKAKTEIEKNKWKLVETAALASSEYLLFRANTAQGLGEHDKELYFEDASFALLNAAQEAQKPPELRNPDIINWFQRAADLRQEAANAWDLGQHDKAIYLNNAGHTFFKAAQEAQKPLELRNPDVINWFQRAADLYQEAVNAWDQNQHDKANYLNNAGSALFQAAKESQKTPDLIKQEVINWLQRTADLCQQAVNACDPDQAIYLNNAGGRLFQAAEEAQKPEPSPEVIARLIKEAKELEEKAINPPSSCIIN